MMSHTAIQRMVCGKDVVQYKAGPMMQEDYIVCRCEDVTLSSIESCMDNTSVLSLHETKRRLRVGMGTCQGRVCGPLLQKIFGETATDSLDRNAVVRPVPLKDIAGRCSSDEAVRP